MEPDKVFSEELAQDRIFNLLFNEDELTWQNIIYDLVKSENMNPWDVDVSLIAQKFLEMLKKLKELDFRISGKVVLASAILLKIKSNKLVDDDILALDNLMSSVDDPESLLDELPLDESGSSHRIKSDNPKLMPKTPQPRKRKVSIYDLIKALEKALEVEGRRPAYVKPKFHVKMPEKGIEMSELISDIYHRVESYYVPDGENKQLLTFTQLIPSDSKEDKVFTFIPLLHLENQRKVDMNQRVHFGEIEIDLAKNKPEEPANEESKQEGSVKEASIPAEKPKKARRKKQDNAVPKTDVSSQAPN